jgi:hypothetical protein
VSWAVVYALTIILVDGRHGFIALIALQKRSQLCLAGPLNESRFSVPQDPRRCDGLQLRSTSHCESEIDQKMLSVAWPVLCNRLQIISILRTASDLPDRDLHTHQISCKKHGEQGCLCSAESATRFRMRW